MMRRINLFGGPGCGKCFGKGTPILMFDGTIKCIEDIKIDDLVMGDDSTPRRVLNLVRGVEPLYKVRERTKKTKRNLVPPYTNSYIVNASHILTLKKGGCFRNQDKDTSFRIPQKFTQLGIARKKCPRCSGYIGNKVITCHCGYNFRSRNRNGRYSHHPSRVGDTWTYNISVKDYLSESDRFQYHMLGYRTMVQFKTKPIRIDPYFLGIWLGDGTNTNCGITTVDDEIMNHVYDESQNRNLHVNIYQNKTAPTYTIHADVFDEPGDENWYAYYLVYPNGHENKERHQVAKILDKLNQCTQQELGVTYANATIQYNVRYTKNWIDMGNIPKYKCIEDIPPLGTGKLRHRQIANNLLRDLDSYDLRNNKHIPLDYRANSETVRLELLAGLIDTDGCNNNDRGYDFINKSQQLAIDCVYLARSLGFSSNLSKVTKSCQTGVSGTYYRVYIGGDCRRIPVKLSRKKIPHDAYSPRSKDPLTYGIMIEPIGEGKYYGLTIDGNNLFVLGDFTVVHNSTTAAGCYAVLRSKGIDIELVPEYIKNWAYEDRKCVSFDQLYVFAKQLRSEDLLLRSDVKYIISDSPLLMQIAYVKKYGVAPILDELMEITNKFEEKYPSLNIWLDRTGIPYKDNGRYEDYDAAIEMDNCIKDLMDLCGMEYETFETRKTGKLSSFLLQHLQ